MSADRGWNPKTTVGPTQDRLGEFQVLRVGRVNNVYQSMALGIVLQPRGEGEGRGRGGAVCKVPHAGERIALKGLCSSKCITVNVQITNIASGQWKEVIGCRK